MIISKTIKRILIALLLVFVFPLSVDHALCEKPDTPMDKQIIMVYMTGSDLETGSGAATNDISEMLRSRYNTDELSVLVMIGGSKKWKSFPSDQTLIYEITGNRPTPVYSGDLLNMGTSDTLSFFLNYCFDNYKASMYSLILWDHGAGPLEGVCFDENFSLPSGKDSLSLEELEKALAASPFSESNKLEWIGFDACLMSSVEVAYKCAPYAKYMIASQEVEPGSGWNYSFLKNIDHLSSGAETGKQIIDTYASIASTNNATSPILTLSCTDLSKVDQIRDLMDVIFGDISKELDTNTYSDLVRKRLQALSIGRNSNDAADFDLVDLLGLIVAYDEDSSASQELQNLIQESIVYNSSNVDGLNGLSIYFPYYNKTYFKSSWNEKYKSLSISGKYSSFLEEYSAIWLSPSAADWSDNKGVHLLTNETETVLTTELTDDQIKDFSSASLYVLSNTGWNIATNNDGFIFVDKSNDVQLIGNMLHAIDPGTILAFCDSEGNVIANDIEYEIVDNKYIIPIKLEDMTFIQAMQNVGTDAYRTPTTTNAKVECLPPDQDGKLQIIRITVTSNDVDILSQGKMDIQLSDYAELSLVQNQHHMTFDQNGQLLPYEQWDQYGLAGYLLDLAEYNYEISVKLINRKDVESADDLFNNYVYLFTITDTKNNRYSTEIKNLSP